MRASAHKKADVALATAGYQTLFQALCQQCQKSFLIVV
nr:MAG TPA: hypothetical protein [Caudoviricetes sp.]